jgi:putative transcriptional regulator
MSRFGQELIEAMGQALAHARGEDVGAIEHRVELEAVDVKAIRRSFGLTQEKMALMLGTSPSGYRKWEQGKRQPSGAARTLLRVMEKEPEAVVRALTL